MSESGLVYPESYVYNLGPGIGYTVEKVEGTFYKFTDKKNPYNDKCPKTPIYVPESGMLESPSLSVYVNSTRGGKRRKPTHKQSKNTRRRSRKN